MAVFLAVAPPPAAGEEYRTPRAGETVTGTLFGKTLSAPERDRRKITYLNIGGVFVPGGPDEKTFGPTGGLYLWRVSPGDSSRLRAIIAGISNEVRWDRALQGSPASPSS